MAGFTIRDGKLRYVHPKTQRVITLGPASVLAVDEQFAKNGVEWRHGVYVYQGGNDEGN